MRRILGIDYGERRMGLALSDPLGMLASSLETVTVNGDTDAARKVAEVCRARDVGRVIVGLPLNMDGTSGPMAQRVQAFVERLRTLLTLPVEACDERLTTRMAERVLLDADVSRARRKEVRDKMAAQLILQSYLDLHAGPVLPPEEEDDEGVSGDV